MKKRFSMEREEWAFYKAEELAPEMAAICGLSRISAKAFWRVQMAAYKALMGRIPYRLMAEKVERACKQSERYIRMGDDYLNIVPVKA